MAKANKCIAHSIFFSLPSVYNQISHAYVCVLRIRDTWKWLIEIAYSACSCFRTLFFSYSSLDPFVSMCKFSKCKKPWISKMRHFRLVMKNKVSNMVYVNTQRFVRVEIGQNLFFFLFLSSLKANTYKTTQRHNRRECLTEYFSVEWNDFRIMGTAFSVFYLFNQNPTEKGRVILSAEHMSTYTSDA